jgi:catechol 2,3-dioxygenase-like lactoylglutathione lyase family enzyme
MVAPVYDGEMLGASPLVAFVPVTDIARVRPFYESVLGLRVVADTPFALIVDANGTTVRITPVGEFRPQPFTVCGWEVADMESTVSELSARGVTFTHYDGMGQRENGVWVSPGGDLVAWFLDPDGNTLSLTQAAP